MSLTRQEVFQALADGKEVEFKHISPNVTAWCAIDNYYNCLNAVTFPTREWRIKPEPHKWYENIPEHGVLCWWNRGISLITGKDGNSYIHNKSQYIRSETHEPIPLTDEEIIKFLRGN